MSRRLILAVAALCAACEQQSHRTIPYRPDMPIAERLEPGDKSVVVEMKMSTPPETTLRESFEREIQRLRKAEMIVLVRVAAAQGEIADRGTWIRTTVNGEIERVVQAPPQWQAGQSIAFSYLGGSTRIGSVDVSTGKFPRFIDGERYLVWLRAQRAGAAALMWSGIGFRVDAGGVLQRVGISDGSEQSLATNLVGRNVSEVADALAPAR